MSEMNEGVRILIDRMQTHPEDFAPPGFSMRDAYVMKSGSWRNLAEYAANTSVFTEEERAAVTAALDEVTRKNFTAKVLEMLAAPQKVYEGVEYFQREYEKAALTGSNIFKYSGEQYGASVTGQMLQAKLAEMKKEFK